MVILFCSGFQSTNEFRHSSVDAVNVGTHKKISESEISKNQGFLVTKEEKSKIEL